MEMRVVDAPSHIKMQPPRTVQDLLDYEQTKQFEDDVDDRFWAELEAEVLHSAEHGRT
jgi:hypothetical protein